MTRYLISFDDGAMTVPDGDLPDVAKAAHQVVEQAQEAGVWVFGGGVKGHQASVVATDGSGTDGRSPEGEEHPGGFAVVDVPSHEEALKWAAKIAVASVAGNVATPENRLGKRAIIPAGVSPLPPHLRRGTRQGPSGDRLPEHYRGR